MAKRRRGSRSRRRRGSGGGGIWSKVRGMFTLKGIINMAIGALAVALIGGGLKMSFDKAATAIKEKVGGKKTVA